MAKANKSFALFLISKHVERVVVHIYMNNKDITDRFTKKCTYTQRKLGQRLRKRKRNEEKKECEQGKCKKSICEVVHYLADKFTASQAVQLSYVKHNYLVDLIYIM